MNPALFLKLVNLGEFFLRSFGIDSKSSSPVLIHKRKNRNVARTISYINHVLEWNSAILARNICVDIYFPNLVYTFVNLKQGPGLSCVVDYIADILNCDF